VVVLGVEALVDELVVSLTQLLSDFAQNILNKKSATFGLS